jgi:hypothetical protein
MPKRSMKEDDPLEDFARREITLDGVVTAHLINEAGQPTIAARDEILAFFAKRLGSRET